jgi:hypothetical protein
MNIRHILNDMMGRTNKMDWKGIWDKEVKEIKVRNFVVQLKSFLNVIVSGHYTIIEQNDEHAHNIYVPMKLFGNEEGYKYTF